MGLLSVSCQTFAIALFNSNQILMTSSGAINNCLTPKSSFLLYARCKMERMACLVFSGLLNQSICHYFAARCILLISCSIVRFCFLLALMCIVALCALSAYHAQEFKPIGTAHNRRAQPFVAAANLDDKRQVVSSSYNSPIGLYSSGNIHDALHGQLRGLISSSSAK